MRHRKKNLCSFHHVCTEKGTWKLYWLMVYPFGNFSSFTKTAKGKPFWITNYFDGHIAVATEQEYSISFDTQNTHSARDMCVCAFVSVVLIIATHHKTLFIRLNHDFPNIRISVTYRVFLAELKVRYIPLYNRYTHRVLWSLPFSKNHR